MGMKVTDNSKLFKLKNALALDKALGIMAANIEKLSKSRVPHDIGTLQETGRHKRLGPLKFEIRYGKGPPSDAPYARRWEYEEPAHGFKKGRQSRYLRSSAEDVHKKFGSYFKAAFATIRL